MLDINNLNSDEIKQLYKEMINIINKDGKNDNKIRLLYLLSCARSSMNVPLVSGILKISAKEAKSAVDFCRELLIEDILTGDAKNYSLFHESLRGYIQNHYQKACRKIEEDIVDYCLNWKKIKDDYPRKYALHHAAEHLGNLGDYERIWELLYDSSYIADQIKEFNFYHVSINSLKEGIALYTLRNGETPEDDARLSWLMLKTGDLFQESKTNIKEVIRWLEERPFEDEQSIPDILRKLEYLKPKEFYQTAILILKIEADRQRKLHEEDIEPKYADLIVDEVQKRCNGVIELFIDEYEINLLFEALDMFPRIIELFNFLNEDNKKWVVSVLVMRGKLDHARDLAEKVKYENYKVEALINIAMKLAEAGEIDKAIKTAGEIENKLDKTKALSEIAEKCAKAGDIDNALKIIEKIEYFQTKLSTLAAVSGQLYLKSRIEQSQEVFIKAMKLVEEIADQCGKNKALSQVALKLVESGDVDKAITATDEITDNKEKTQVLYSVADKLAETGDTDKAMSIAEIVIDEKYKIKALKKIAYKLERNGDFDRILEIAKKIEDKKCKLELLEKIVEKLAEYGNIDRALKVAEEIENKEYKTTALKKIVDKLLEEDDIDRALKVTEEIKGYKDHELVSIAFKMIELGEIERALGLAEKIKHETPRSMILSYVLKAPVKAENINKAQVLLEDITNDNKRTELLHSLVEKMIELGDINRAWEIAEREKNDYLFRILAKNMAEKGDTDRAKEIAERIKDKDGKVSVLISIADHLIKNDKVEQAKEKLSEALVISDSMINIDKYFTNSRTSWFSLIVKRLREVGDNNWAKEIEGIVLSDSKQSEDLKSKAEKLYEDEEYEKVKEILVESLEAKGRLEYEDIDGHEYEVKDKTKVLSPIAVKLAEAGDVDRAWKISKKIKNEYSKALALEVIAGKLAETGDLDRANQLAEIIEDKFDKSKILISIAGNLIKVGEVEKAKEILAEAKELADKIRYGHIKALALYLITEKFVEAGDLERARKAAEKIDRLWERMKAFAAINGKLTEVLDVDKVMLIDRQMEDSWEKVNQYNLTALELTKFGEMEKAKEVLAEALEITERIEDEKSKLKALASIALILSDAGDVKKSNEIINQNIKKSYNEPFYDLLFSCIPDDTVLSRSYFNYCPQDTHQYYKSVRALILYNIKQGKMDYFDAIVEKCPQLGLGFLVVDKYDLFKGVAEVNMEKVKVWLDLVERDLMSMDVFEQKKKGLIDGQ